MPPESKYYGNAYAILNSGERVPIKELQDVTLDYAEEILKEYEFIKVVRCGECVYMEDLGSGLRQCNRFTDILIDADDYCSKGRRRSDGKTDRH